jgi:hypothetical protein
MFFLHARGLQFFTLAVGLGLLLGVAPLHAGPTTRPAQSAGSDAAACSNEIDALIVRLTDPRWHVRDRAVERLVELGASAERQLLAARDSASNVDARARMEMALGRIHESRRSGPTYVSLHLSNAPAHDALAAMAAEARVKFDSGPTAVGHTISLDADHQPFWRVLRNLCSQARLEVGAIDASGTILLRGGDDDWGHRPAAIEGPYMLLARRIELTRSLDLANPHNVNNTYTLVLLAYAEPKLRPIYWTLTGVDQSITDTGRALELPSDGFEPGDLNADSETHIQFTGPADVGTKLTKLRLGARFILSDKTQHIELPNILKVKNETLTSGGWRIAIKGVTKNDDDRYSAALTVYRDNHTPDEWNERTGLLDRAQPRLLDSAGKTMESGGTSLNQGPDEWNWSDECSPANPDEKPARLLWDFPLETRHADVTFEFRNLPLP